MSRLKEILNKELRIPEKVRARIAFMRVRIAFIYKKYVLPLGFLAVMIPYFIAAVIGVWRGYSIQVEWPNNLAFWGGFTILVLTGATLVDKTKPRDKIAQYVMFSFLILFFIDSRVTNTQSRPYFAATVCYNKGQYQQALEHLSKVINSWIPHIRQNRFESSAMTELAKTYCQLEQFDKAVETYSLSLDRYDYRRTSAVRYLRELKTGLEELEDHKEIIDNGDGTFEQYYEIGDIYRCKLNCYSKARIFYNKALELEGSDWDKKRIKEHLEDIEPEE